MKRLLVLAFLLFSLPLLPSCKHLGAALPVIAEIIGDIAKAQEALKTIDKAAATYFIFNPDEKLQIKYAKLKGIADNALSGLLHAASGAEKLTNDDIDAAWNDFRKAYSDTISALVSSGFRVQLDDSLQAGGDESMPLISVPSPDKMRRTAR